MNTWIGPFGVTRIKEETLKAYQCERELSKFNPAIFLTHRDEYPNLWRLGKHIETMQEYHWQLGAQLDEA